MVCKKCGQELPENTQFCTSCGASTTSDDNTEVTASSQPDQTEAPIELNKVENNTTGEVPTEPTSTEGTSETPMSFGTNTEAPQNFGAETPAPFSSQPPTQDSANPFGSAFNAGASGPVTTGQPTPPPMMGQPPQTPNAYGQSPQVNVPEGFTFDPATGLYQGYRSGNDPMTGQPMQKLVYFNAQTNQYQETPQSPLQYQGSTPYAGMPQQKPKKSWPIVLLVIVIVFVIIIAGVVLVANLGKAKGGPAKQDDTIVVDSWKDFGGKEDEKPADAPKADESVEAFSTASEELAEPDAMDNSMFATEGAYSDGLYYFLDEDAKSVLVTDSEIDTAIPIISTEDDCRVVSIEAIGNYLIVCVAEEDDEGYITYAPNSAVCYVYDTDHIENEPVEFYRGLPVYMATYKGYLYLIEDDDYRIQQYGLDEKGKVSLKQSYKLDIAGGEQLYLTNFSIRDNVAYYATYSRSEENYNQYIFDLNSQKSLPIYKGGKGELYINGILKDDILFINTLDENYDGTLAYYKAGEKEPTVIDTFGEGDDLFAYMAIIGDTFYYQKNGDL